VAPGEFVTLVGAGIGLAGNSALFDGTPAPSLYASPNQVNAAPTLVAGVLQVNCIVPANAHSGSTVPIVYFIGKTSNHARVTLAIQ
jgi:hypothetical protein